MSFGKALLMWKTFIGFFSELSESFIRASHSRYLSHQRITSSKISIMIMIDVAYWSPWLMCSGKRNFRVIHLTRVERLANLWNSWWRYRHLSISFYQFIFAVLYSQLQSFLVDWYWYLSSPAIRSMGVMSIVFEIVRLISSQLILGFFFFSSATPSFSIFLYFDSWLSPLSAIVELIRIFFQCYSLTN